MSHIVAYCFVSSSPVRATAKDSSEMVTQLLFGELFDVLDSDEKWAKITTFNDHYTGFIDCKHLKFLSEKEVNRWLDGLGYQKETTRKILTPWGEQTIYRGSFIPSNESEFFNIGKDHFNFLDQKQQNQFKNPFEAAKSYLNTPYLWGGKTPFGIDCSGLTQQSLRFFDFNLPRDAYQQEELGNSIDFEEAQENDLAFFENTDGKIIHVGIIGPEKQIIHASGRVRIDHLTPQGIINNETGAITHFLKSIKRM